jgi:hypothetical protein
MLNSVFASLVGPLFCTSQTINSDPAVVDLELTYCCGTHGG